MSAKSYSVRLTLEFLPDDQYQDAPMRQLELTVPFTAVEETSESLGTIVSAFLRNAGGEVERLIRLQYYLDSIPTATLSGPRKPTEQSLPSSETSQQGRIHQENERVLQRLRENNWNDGLSRLQGVSPLTGSPVGVESLAEDWSGID